MKCNDDGMWLTRTLITVYIVYSRTCVFLSNSHRLHCCIAHDHWAYIDRVLIALGMEAFMFLWATSELTLMKNGASTQGTGGHSTFWPTVCIIFCQKVCHWFPSWSYHRLQCMAAILKPSTLLPRKSNRSDAELDECCQSHMLSFGKYL